MTGFEHLGRGLWARGCVRGEGCSVRLCAGVCGFVEGELKRKKMACKEKKDMIAY